MNNINKKAQISLGIIILAFIGIIVGLALFNASADEVSISTTKGVVSNQTVSVLTGYVDEDNVNESINYSIYTQSAWKVLECPLESVVIRNGADTDLVADADYTLDADNGEFSLLNTSLTIPVITANVTYADYSFCRDGYNTQASSRAIINLVLIFLAIALMAFAYAPVREALANMGMGN